MKSYNNVTLIGRPVRDPDKRSVGESNTRTTFSIAVDRPYKDSEGKHPTDFINIVAWGKLAEICAEYIGKDSLVLISGRIQSRSYEVEIDSTDLSQNETHWITEIIAESINVLEYSRKSKEAKG